MVTALDLVVLLPVDRVVTALQGEVGTRPSRLEAKTRMFAVCRRLRQPANEVSVTVCAVELEQQANLKHDIQVLKSVQI